ncbi:MAG: DUF2189 domain-containing protein [Pseudomonadota bacterium]
MTNTTPQAPSDALPFAAPCRRLEARAPLRWLRLGWHDLKRAPRQSLTYGAGIWLLSVLVSYVAWAFGNGWMLILLLSSFVFVAPVLALGLYALSAQLERGEKPSLTRCLVAERASLGDALVYSLILLVIALVWVRAGSALQNFWPELAEPSLADVVSFFAIGSAVGSLFALLAFAASAFALPMLVDRRADGVTAVVTSINAVLKNKPAMAVWVLLIVGAVVVGFATLLVGLAVTMPLIGHATWHAYRETIDAGAWPPRE